MEDEVSIQTNFTVNYNNNIKHRLTGLLSFFGVFDGHGGRSAAVFSRDNLYKNLVAQLELGLEPADALSHAFIKTDEQFIAQARINENKTAMVGNNTVYMNISPCDKDTSGSTALCLLIHHQSKQIWVGNAGDSRAILINSNGSVVALSRDHKADRPDEIERIRKAGGFVVHKRVMGELAISRAIGDLDFKEKGFLFVLADPEIESITLTAQHSYIILACDGLYDVMTNENIAEYMVQQDKQGLHQQQISENIVKNAIEKLFTRDNVTTIVIKLIHSGENNSAGSNSHCVGPTIHRSDSDATLTTLHKTVSSDDIQQIRVHNEIEEEEITQQQQSIEEETDQLPALSSNAGQAQNSANSNKGPSEAGEDSSNPDFT
jgi:protein phosphatase 2C family protein 2/3